MGRWRRIMTQHSRSSGRAASRRMIRASARPLAACQKLYDYSLSTLPSVQRLSSTLVMKKQNRPLPL